MCSVNGVMGGRSAQVVRLHRRAWACCCGFLPGRTCIAPCLCLCLQRAPRVQVRHWINCGVHIGASDQVYVCWGRRLLCAPGLLPRGPQALILQLLADYPQASQGRGRAAPRPRAPPHCSASWACCWSVWP